MADPLGHARGHRLVSAAGRLEPYLPEHRLHSPAVDRAALDLPAHVHHLLRRHALVPPSDLPPHARRGARRDGLDPCRQRSHPPAAIADRRVLRRLVSRLHVLSRRTGATQALAAVSDAFLPDGVARWRDRLGAGWPGCTARPAGVFRARVGACRVRGPPRVSGPAHALRIRRACHRVAAVLGRRRRMEHPQLLREHGACHAQFLRRPSCPGVERWHRDLPPVAHPWHHPARHSVSRPRARATPDELLHGNVRHRTSAGVDASFASAAESRRHRARHWNDRDLWQQGRRLPLLRYQSGGDRHRQA